MCASVYACFDIYGHTQKLHIYESHLMLCATYTYAHRYEACIYRRWFPQCVNSIYPHFYIYVHIWNSFSIYAQFLYMHMICLCWFMEINSHKYIFIRTDSSAFTKLKFYICAYISICIYRSAYIYNMCYRHAFVYMCIYRSYAYIEDGFFLSLVGALSPIMVPRRWDSLSYIGWR